MLKTFFALMARHISKSILNTIIGLIGMVFGLTVFLLIVLWVTDQYQYDQFNVKKEQIYRLELDDDKDKNKVLLPSGLAPLLKENLPEIEDAVRLRILIEDAFVKKEEEHNDNYYGVGKYTYANNDFFQAFSFKFLFGDPETALLNKHDVVITDKLAQTVFGRADVVGETLSLDDLKLNITGVIKEEPNFHIPIKMVISFISLDQKIKDLGYFKGVDTWGFSYMPTYVCVQETTDVKALEQKITSLLNQHRPDHLKKNGDYVSHLRPLNDIYFKGGEAKEEGYAIHGNLKKVRTYISIVILILILVCVNFINLNTSKHLNRVKEVGIKKIFGAPRKHLFLQFLSETGIMILLSLILSIVVSYSLLPHFNNLMYSNLQLSDLFDPINVIVIIAGVLILGIISGGIPALYITSFNPIQILKGLLKKGKGGNGSRVSLVSQFTLTLLLLIATLSVYYQIDYMKNSDLGFNKEYVVQFPFVGTNPQKLESLKTRLKSNPNILDVSSTLYGVPAMVNSADREKEPLEYNGNEYSVAWAWADNDYMNVLDLKLVEGEFFNKNNRHKFVHKSGKISTSFSNDKSDPISEFISSIILNETAVKTIGLEEPIGKNVKFWGRKYSVVGVIKDFHMSSLDSPITPMLYMNRGGYSALAKISSNNIPETIKFIEQKVNESVEGYVDIRFLDEEFDKQYRQDENFSTLLGYATLFTILIACLGLLGIISHAIKLKMKEIGVRKSMGSSSIEILILLIKPIILLVIISSLLAMPISWLVVNDWLSNYPYSIGINWWIFVFAFMFILITTVLTIFWKSWRASTVNPVDLIRDE